jgi:hypothetical protein
MKVFSSPDCTGFCGLGISRAPAARNVYSSVKKKLASSMRGDIYAGICRPAGADPQI